MFANIATTKISSKGQVDIPENIRNGLKLKVDSQFVVVGEKDMIMFKSFSPFSLDQFGSLMIEVKKQAQKAGIQQSDIKDAIAKARTKS